MKLLLQRRLPARLAVKQTLTFAFLATLVAWSAYALLTRRLYDRLDDELQDRSIAVRTMLQISGNVVHWLSPQADPEVRDQFADSVRYYRLIGSQGQTLEGSHAMLNLALPLSRTANDCKESTKECWETVAASGIRLRVVDAPLLGTQGRHHLLQIATPLQPLEEESHLIAWFLVFLTASLVAIHAINAWLSAEREMRPLENLAATARQMNPLDLKGRFPVSDRGDEVDQLGSSLNAMISRLQSSSLKMSDFLRNLSHEIRQPLTVLRAETEQALRFESGEAEYRATLSKQLEHVELLARTVSDLLELAQSDSEEIKLRRQAEDLSELVQAAIDGMRIKAGEQNITISGTVQQNVIGDVDAGQLWRMLLNLLDNAIKFNRPTGRIDVVLASHDDSAIISVSDTGVGIPPEAQPHIFERGYRVPSTAASQVPGTGLGLHFVVSIVAAHGGKVEVTSTQGEGSCFRVTIPLMLGSSSQHSSISAAQDSSIH